MSGNRRTVSAMNGNQSTGVGTDEEVRLLNPTCVQPLPERLVYRLPEAGQLLGGITRKTVKALIDQGELETVPVGAYAMVTRESIYAYIERGKERSRAADAPAA